LVGHALTVGDVQIGEDLAAAGGDALLAPLRHVEHVQHAGLVQPAAAHHLTATTASPLSPKGQKQTEADGMARLREREGRLGVVTHMQLATCAPKNRVTGTGRPSVGHHIHGSQTKEKRW
jgi:hypothetical protein